MTIWRVPGTILEIHDADTFTVMLDLGWGVTYRSQVRLLGCNAPEVDTKAGKAALAWTLKTMPIGSLVTVESRKREKYGRVLGSVILPDGRDFSALLIEAGHALPWNGRGPRP